MTKDKKVIATLLEDPETKATILHVIALTTIGEDVYALDPIVIFAELEETYNCRVHDSNENKLNAILLAVSTGLFFEDLEVFKAVCNTLSDGDIGDLTDEAFNPVTVSEMLWAVYEIEHNCSVDESGASEFSDAITQFIAQLLEDEHPDTDVDAPETASDIEELPYFDRYVASEKRDLLEQMVKLEVPIHDIQQWLS